ncbi:hypothetical protein THASP1DRAFT_29196 [Thamnocephalis sphaerospora]|uniref:CID domain-containing protein n=1 Tax=Thamnocephalis sphaerospora TaxID=78915 RepID=A0A4P9XSB0_9FUNG|nr:hypothetical protein THASP1DRAFT_29196 [Thamnocephalis sphaerospora]|eukprot:RKP09005.1 hypothetical protein THASP1DRAFT_29196 [Thamnocephalis sphaerospora]
MATPEQLAFDKELHALLESKPPIKAARVDQLTRRAVKSARSYKTIVYCVEKFIQKCPREYRLSGVYLVDSICRQGPSLARKLGPAEGIGKQELGYVNEYATRFGRGLEAMFRLLVAAGDVATEKGKKLLDIWEKFGTFDKALLARIRQEHFGNSDGSKAGSSSTRSAQAVDQHTEIAKPLAQSLNVPPANSSASDSAQQTTTTSNPLVQLLSGVLHQNPQLAAVLKANPVGIAAATGTAESSVTAIAAAPSMMSKSHDPSDPSNYDYDEEDDDGGDRLYNAQPNVAAMTATQESALRAPTQSWAQPSVQTSLGAPPPPPLPSGVPTGSGTALLPVDFG